MGQQVKTQLPFKTGQTLAEVLQVTKRTGRVLKDVEFHTLDGKRVIIPVSRHTDIKNNLIERGIDPSQLFLLIRRRYQDCSLLFAFSNGEYRVQKVET